MTGVCGGIRADKLSPFKFYQHLLTSVADAEVVKFLRMLTFLPMDEITAIEVLASIVSLTSDPLSLGQVQRYLPAQVNTWGPDSATATDCMRQS